MFYRYAKLNEGAANEESVFIVTQTSAKACPKVTRRIPWLDRDSGERVSQAARAV